MEMDRSRVPARELGDGLRRLRASPRPRDAAADPLARATALVLCDVAWHDTAGRASPRQVLRAQVERAEKLGLTPMFGSELEFFLLRETHAEAYVKHYRDLTPSVPYILDYHVLATTYDEPFIRQIRNGMHAAGIKVETSKGEAWPGQQEINFRYADALTMADNHAVYKNGSKEIAHLNRRSITFMAKPDQLIGSRATSTRQLARRPQRFRGESPTFRRWLAGQIANLKELALFVAPNVNSYKRFAAGSWAPTTLAWGHDNRPRCGFRIVGHDSALRTETRIPGADANPTSRSRRSSRRAWTGSSVLRLPSPLEGNAYESDADRFRTRCARRSRRSKRARWPARLRRRGAGRPLPRTTRAPSRSFFDRAVTCYERERFFERG